ncbi:hypothetical protein IJE86_05660 [bacterium]|nr:hypothetical protein [bacterium]
MVNIKPSSRQMDYLIDKYGMNADIDGDGRLSQQEMSFIFDSIDKKTKKVDEQRLNALIHNYKNRTEEQVSGCFTFKRRYVDAKLAEKSIICVNPQTNQVEFIETDKYNSLGKPTETIVLSKRDGTEITKYDSKGNIISVQKSPTAKFEVVL